MGSHDALPALIELGLICIPASIFEEFERVMVDVGSWNARQVNTEKTLKTETNFEITSIDLSPGLLDEDSPEKFLLRRATEYWKLVLLRHRQIVVYNY